MDSTQNLGKLGEEMAARYLRNRGYKILERNFRYLKGEVDLIAIKDEVVAIIEVKTRSGPALERISEAIQKKKIERLFLVADHYLITHKINMEVRFDVIWITCGSRDFILEHMENAFYHF